MRPARVRSIERRGRAYPWKHFTFRASGRTGQHAVTMRRRRRRSRGRLWRRCVVGTARRNNGRTAARAVASRYVRVCDVDAFRRPPICPSAPHGESCAPFSRSTSCLVRLFVFDDITNDVLWRVSRRSHTVHKNNDFSES